MQIIYKAFDGSEFKDKYECLEYERGDGLGFLMYNAHELTWKFLDASIIFIDGECGLRKFEAYCKQNGYETNGINKEGVWVKNSNMNNFTFLEDGILNKIADFCNGKLGAYI